jgi:hypothetical protein
LADYTIQGADPRWKRFEKLVARMLTTLSTGAEVVYDDAIRGRLSEADRQIDVSVRSRVGGVEQLVVVQCRDYKSPLDVNAVGEFDSVIRDVGATKGIMVSVPGRVVETHRFGFWQLAKIEGLANELDGSITSRGFTTTGFDIEDVLKNGLDVPSPEQTPTRPTMRLTTAGGWDWDESIEPPSVGGVRFVAEREFKKPTRSAHRAGVEREASMVTPANGGSQTKGGIDYLTSEVAQCKAACCQSIRSATASDWASKI